MDRNNLKQALVLRHVAFEDLDAFEAPLQAAGYGIAYCEAGLADFRTMASKAADLLIVLGGPIGVYEEAVYPFLKDEIHFIETRIKQNLPTLGICLGAQLIARAAGARVFPSGVKEIGFMPITLTKAGKRSCLAPFADDGITLHWHGDTFDLPKNATHLASSALCENQAFCLSQNILGVQFHPEMSGEKIETWLIGHTGELQNAGIDISGLRAEAARLAGGLKLKAAQVLKGFLAGL